MDKSAVGKQMGGFMQTRVRTRPYRVETLLEKDLHSSRPSEVFADAIHDAEAKYDAQLAADEGDEFTKEGAAKQLEFVASEKPTVADLPKYLFHGSPGGYDKLENKGEGVHLTVAPALASAFVIKRGDVTKGRSGKVRNAQSIWNKPLAELQKPVTLHDVSVLPSRGAKNPIVPGESGISKGFVYKVETAGIRDQLHINAAEPREIIFSGASIPVRRKIPVRVNWTTKRDPKLRGGPGINTFARSIRKMAVGRIKLSQAEFAPGIPKGRVIRPIPRVPTKGGNPNWTVSLSAHPARIRGDHHDLRLIDPKGDAHSWAFNAMPEPGKSTYAPQQATHSGRYARRTKPFTIPPGYGATRPGAKVEPKYVQDAEIISASNKRVHLLRHHGQETDELILKHVAEPRPGKPLWVLHNATKTRDTLEGKKLPSSKPRYKEIRPEKVDFSDVGEVMVPKLDGAHVLVDLKGPKRPMRIHSYRPTTRPGGLIEHTFKFPGFQNRTSSSGLKNTLIRAELWGSDKGGKAIPAERLGGILNSGVPKSRATQAEQGIKLRLTGIDVVRHKGKDYANKDFGEKLKVLREVTRGTKGRVELPTVARTEAGKRQMLGAIKAGKLPETKEGVVLHRVDSAAPPTKAKIKEQTDVYIRKIFDKPKGKAKGQAGGFWYATSPDGPVVGKVGTGFSQKVRRDMLSNPEKYVGRVAKVESQGPFRSGALRAPSFSEWHIDKTPPELMKEGAARPTTLRSTLLPHQQRVVDKIRKNPGLVVAHGTGSGKTLSSIGAVVDLSPQRARVLVPAALKANYEKEIKKHVRGGLPITVESIQKAVKDGNPPRGDLLIVDEAHRVRNPQSKGYRLLRQSKADKRMLLTASPVYNMPEDVAPLVNIAAGGKVLPEGSEFRQRFVQQPGKGFFSLINPFAERDAKIVHKKELGRVLNKWVDYHGSSADRFPSLSEERVNVTMNRAQSALHNEAWGQLPLMTRLRLGKGLPPGHKDLASINQFQAQTRQISSSERKYTGGDPGSSPKIQSAVSRLRTEVAKNPRHKAVVYANYLGTLDDYSKELTDKGISHTSFRGDMKRKERDQNVRDFNAGKVKALLVSGAGGEGLDLKGTRQIQVLEPHWNEEKLWQVIGRARRYKSHDHLPPKERKVKVERYASRPRGFFGPKKGVEDILYNTASQKQRLNDQVLDLMTQTGRET